jgi:hypothetical protein
MTPGKLAVLRETASEAEQQKPLVAQVIEQVQDRCHRCGNDRSGKEAPLENYFMFPPGRPPAHAGEQIEAFRLFFPFGPIRRVHSIRHLKVPVY